MLTLLSGFVKKYLSTNTGIFISIFVGIIAIFIFFNFNTILSKFGFETTTTLKALLVKSQEDLKRATEINKDLNNTIDRLKNSNKNKLESVTGFYKEKEELSKKALNISKRKSSKDRELIKNLEGKITKTKDTITISVAEYNELSKSNINILNETYDSFFNDTALGN